MLFCGLQRKYSKLALIRIVFVKLTCVVTDKSGLEFCRLFCDASLGYFKTFLFMSPKPKDESNLRKLLEILNDEILCIKIVKFEEFQHAQSECKQTFTNILSFVILKEFKQTFSNSLSFVILRQFCVKNNQSEGTFAMISQIKM